MASTKRTAPVAANDEHKELVGITLRYGFGEPDLRLRKDRLERSMKHPVEEIEAAFSLLSELLTTAETVHEKVALYFGMAEIVHLRGDDPTQPLLAIHQTDLETFKELGFRLVRLETSKDACPECKKLSGKVISIEEALSSNPLPHRACKHDIRRGRGLCRCRFLAEFG
ncbi:MAG: hypothetical protein ABR986_05320 [Methanomassiliicoccales archaeon]|jgi:hypothetical protein